MLLTHPVFLDVLTRKILTAEGVSYYCRQVMTIKKICNVKERLRYFEMGPTWIQDRLKTSAFLKGKG